MRVEKEIFADGVGEISLVHGMVHFEYFVSRKNESGNQVKVPTARIVVPLQGFLTSWQSVQDIARQMLECGILTEVPKVQPEAPVTRKRSAKKKPASRSRKKTSA